MKKSYKNKFTKISQAGFWAALLILIFCTNEVMAQTPSYYNRISTAGSGCNVFPLGGGTNKVQWIYGPNTLRDNGASGNIAFAGLITHVYFRLCSGVNANTVYPNFTIYLGQNYGTTSPWTNGTTWQTGLDTVYHSASQQLTGAQANTFYRIQLQRPFVYDPNLSLVFEISHTGTAGGNQMLQTNNGTGGRRWGVNGNAAGNGTDANNVDFGIDIVPLNINLNSITFPSSVCQEDVNDVTVEIENTDVVARSGFIIQYLINDVVAATETYTASIPAAAKRNFTFSTKIASKVPGNFKLSARILGKAIGDVKYYDVKPSPLGSYGVSGTPFTGSFNAGDNQDPDIVAYGDQIVHEFLPPTGYSNADYGSTWQFGYITFLTPSGSNAGSTQSFTNPSGANNAFSSFTPTIGLTDSVFKIKYRVESLSNGCLAPEYERTIFVAPRPVAGFSSSTACDGAPIQFTNSSSISSGFVSYEWHFGDGNTSLLENPEHTYATHGTYNAKLYAVSNYGYKDSAFGSVVVQQLPTADFTAVNTCQGTANSFTDASFIPSGTPTYSWDFGDNSSATGPNVSRMYANTGNYEVTLTVDVAGCKSSKSRIVTYAPRATVDFSSATSCNNDKVSFTNNSTLSSGNMGFTWRFGDGNIASSKNPIHQYAAFNSYNVTLVANTDLGCKDSITKNIAMLESPAASFTNNNACSGDTVFFNNTSYEPAGHTTIYTWNFGDGNSLAGHSPSYIYKGVGQYTAELTATSSNGCSDMSSTVISVGVKPTVSFLTQSLLCLGSKSTFANASIAGLESLTYSWNFDNGMTSSAKDTSFAYATAGTFNVSLLATTAAGCSDVATQTVTISAIPASTFTQSSGEKGDGTMVFLGPAGTGNAYNWSFGDGNRSSVQSPVHTYAYDGNYTVNLTVTNSDGCKSSSSQQIGVFRLNVNKASELKNVSLFPNPNNGSFSVVFEDNKWNTANYSITNVLGQQVAQGVLTLNKNKADFMLNNLTEGTYIIQLVNSSGENGMLKFIVK